MTCEFCNTIYSEPEILKKFAELNKDTNILTTYYLGQNSNKEIYLYSLTFTDDPMYSSWDCLPVSYCPVCGRQLSTTRKENNNV